MAEPEALKHQTLMTEQGIKKAELPKEIQSKIQGLSLAIGKYNNNPDDNKKEKITKTDLIIANEIIDWIAAGKKPTTPAPATPTPTPEQLAAIEEKKIKDAQQAEAAEKARLDQEAADKKVADEKVFIEKLNAQGGRIHVSDIATILGRTPNTQEVISGIAIRKIPLGDGFYRLA